MRVPPPVLGLVLGVVVRSGVRVRLGRPPRNDFRGVVFKCRRPPRRGVKPSLQQGEEAAGSQRNVHGAFPFCHTATPGVGEISSRGAAPSPGFLNLSCSRHGQWQQRWEGPNSQLHSCRAEV
ncbi:hypothetical protein FKM82_022923 [Ascaphus truei]